LTSARRFQPQELTPSGRYSFVLMTALRLFIVSVACTVLAACQHSTRAPSGPAASGNVARNAAAARADTERAFTLIQSGKYAEAEPLLKRAVEEDPDYGPAHNDLGIVHYQAERWYDAAWEFQNAIKLMPGQPEPHNNLGLVLESALRLKEAETSFEKAHELDPQNPQYAGNLARLRIRLGKRDEKTRELLEIVVLSDSRSEWIDWARFNLSRLQSHSDEMPSNGAASRPAPMPGQQ
jgi:Flp pilus assembly protein TadD